MISKDIKNEITRLRSEVVRHRQLYYDLSKPEISDFEFDQMYRRLVELEKQYPDLDLPDSPTHTVGSTPSGRFKDVKHAIPMLSLDNAMDEAEFLAFHAKISRTYKQPSFLASVKLDGLSSSITYRNGILDFAALRGDGKSGEALTDNIKLVQGIPHELASGVRAVPYLLEVRGEVFMTKKNFEELNRELEEAGQEPYSNARNAASGILRSDKKYGKDRLSFYAYAPGVFHRIAGDKSLSGFTTRSEFLYAVGEWGIPFNHHSRIVSTPEECLKFYHDVLDERYGAIEMEIDGVVYVIDNFDHFSELGFTASAPRGGIAYKFPPMQAQTKLLSVTFQVGRTGVIVPVAELEPVMCGTNISRATLHNMSEVRRKDIRINDICSISRHGDVIPALDRVVIEKRTGEEIPISAPTVCPVCGGKVIQIEGEVAIRCQNGTTCPAQVQNAIEHFCERKGADIEGLGTKYIQALRDLGKLESVSDIYYLKKEDFLNIPRVGDKVATKLMAAIEGSKTRPLQSFLYALGIPQIGEGGAKRLAEHFQTFEKIQNATLEELITIPDFGEITAKCVIEYFKSGANVLAVERMFHAGVKPASPSVKNGEGVLTGKVVVFTGTLVKLSRDEAKAFAEKHGAKVTDSISRKTSYLVAGPGAGSKLEKSASLGVPVLSEDEFLSMVNA